MITSAQNALVKQIRRLARDRRARAEAGLFVVEGIQGVVEAVQSDAPLHALIYAPERLSSKIAQAAIARAEAQGVRCEAVSVGLFGSLSSRDNPAGIMALVEQRLVRLDDLAVHKRSLFVALDQVSDPGNLGTVLRTIDASGADALLLVGQTADPFHPTTVKASAATIFSVPIVMVAELTALLAWCERAGVAIVATSDKAEQSYWSVRYPSPCLLLMGSEAHGLPSQQLEQLPQVVHIPMHGTADSLNLGVATALLLYEVCRQQEEALER